MSAVNVVFAAAVGFIFLLLGKVSLDLMTKELQGQAEQLPHRLDPGFFEHGRWSFCSNFFYDSVRCVPQKCSIYSFR